MIKEHKYADGGSTGKFVYGSSEMLKKELANNLRDLQAMNKVMENNEMPKSYVSQASRLQSRNEELIKELKHRGININSILYKDYFKMADGGGVGEINSLEGSWRSYNKGVMSGKKDEGYITIKNEEDLNDYITSKIGNVVKDIKVIEKGKDYPYNRSNPYFEDTYLVTLKNGTTFEVERSYGRPNWSGNVDYVENIRVKNINDKYADSGRIDLFQDYDNIPANVQKVLNKYAEKYDDDFSEMDYNDMSKMKKDIEKLGYTFDSGLDNEPYGLRPVGVKITELEGFEDFEEYANGGSIKNNDDYRRAEDKYHYYGALLMDAIEENNTTEITKLKEQMEKLETEINRYERNYADGGKIGFRNLDKIKSHIGESVFNHIGSLNKKELEKQLSELRNELKITDKESSRYYKLKDEEWFILYRLERSSEYRYADGGSVGEIEAKIADFRRRAENKSIPESAKNKFLSMAEELEKTLPKAEKKEEVKAEKPKFKVGDVVVLQGGDNLRKKITSIKENKKGEIIYSGYYESKPSEKFSMDGTELVIFKRPKKEPKEKKEKAESKKAELTEKECNELLEKYKAEREARKERAEKREKQGKPAELTPAETAKKAVNRVTNKIEAKAEKGKSVKGDIKAVFSQFKSAVAELKKYKNEIDEKEVRNLIKELESLLTK